MLENENLNEAQKPQLNIGAVISCALLFPHLQELALWTVIAGRYNGKEDSKIYNIAYNS